MANPKFYYAPGACSLAPHILLHELNISFTPIPNIINATAVSFTPGFETVNPKLRVPVLVIGEEVITETPAILVAICTLLSSQMRNWVDEENGVEGNERVEEGKGEVFLGRTPIEKIRVLEWMNWISGTLHGHAFGGLLRPWRLTDDVDAYDGIKKKAMENVREAFGVIERKFQIQIKDEELDGEGRDGGEIQGEKEWSWAVGENFTVVDAYLFVFWRWGVGFGIEMKEEFPRYSGMVGRLVRRDGVRRALREEGIEVPV